MYVCAFLIVTIAILQGLFVHDESGPWAPSLHDSLRYGLSAPDAEAGIAFRMSTASRLDLLLADVVAPGSKDLDDLG